MSVSPHTEDARWWCYRCLELQQDAWPWETLELCDPSFLWDQNWHLATTFWSIFGRFSANLGHQKWHTFQSRFSLDGRCHDGPQMAQKMLNFSLTFLPSELTPCFIVTLDLNTRNGSTAASNGLKKLTSLLPDLRVTVHGHEWNANSEKINCQPLY